MNTSTPVGHINRHAESKQYCIRIYRKKKLSWKLQGQERHTCRQICRWKQKRHFGTFRDTFPHTDRQTRSENWRAATLAGTAVCNGWLYLQCYTRARGRVNGASSSSFIWQWYRKDGCHTERKITHLLDLWNQTNTAGQKMFGSVKRRMTDRLTIMMHVTTEDPFLHIVLPFVHK